LRTCHSENSFTTVPPVAEILKIMNMKTQKMNIPAKIFITTEEGINTQFPGRQVVLTTENFKVK
jgi:hypothetical protein